MAARTSIAEEVLDHRLMRLVLAVLIIVSVIPFDAMERQLRPFFLAVFGAELIVRLWLIATHKIRPTRADWAFIAFDVVALVSFLPLEAMFGHEAHWLRAFRLVRLLVLIRFTQALARDLWRVLTRREQLQQLSLVTVGVCSLSFVGAVVVGQLDVRHDFDASGAPGNETFWDQIWWSFRQVESPDNLVRTLGAQPMALVTSLLLTIFGIFVFSYLIGVGANVVEQVLRAERRRPIGYRGHTLVVGPVHRSELLVREFVRIYEKNRALRRIGLSEIWGWLVLGHGRPRRQASPRMALLGEPDHPPSYLYEAGMRWVVYRQGEGADPEALARVNIDRVKRVVLLAPAKSADPDAITLARLAAIRARNRSAHVFVEVRESRNEALVEAVGGAGTFPLDSTRFLGLFLCHHLIVPGIEHLLDELLSARGSEMYTHLFVDAWERRRLGDVADVDFAELAAYAHRESGVTLLGSFVGSKIQRGTHALVPVDQVSPWVNPLEPRSGRGSDPKGMIPAGEFQGFFGIADTYLPMRQLARTVLTGKARADRREGAATALMRRVSLSEERPPRRVLVIGFSPALAPMIDALAHFVAEVEVRVVLDGTREAARKQAEMLGASLDDVTAKVLERDGRLRVFHEPEDLATLASRHVSSHGLDAAVFLSDDLADDPDATTTLRVLHFVEALPVPTDYRLMVELEHAHRGEQLGQQLKRLKHRQKLTLLSTQQIKNYFMVHSAFVPGLTGIYLSLLGARGQDIVRIPLRPEPDGQPVRYGAIREAFFEHGCIPVALQVSGEILLNPNSDARFAGGDIQAVYAVAEADFLHERFPERPSLPVD